MSRRPRPTLTAVLEGITSILCHGKVNGDLLSRLLSGFDRVHDRFDTVMNEASGAERRLLGQAKAAEERREADVKALRADLRDLREVLERPIRAFDQHASHLAYFGPLHCPKGCGRWIVRLAKEQGGTEYTVPGEPVLPNTVWVEHRCQPEG